MVIKQRNTHSLSESLSGVWRGIRIIFLQLYGQLFGLFFIAVAALAKNASCNSNDVYISEWFLNTDAVTSVITGNNLIHGYFETLNVPITG